MSLFRRPKQHQALKIKYQEQNTDHRKAVIPALKVD